MNALVWDHPLGLLALAAIPLLAGLRFATRAWRRQALARLGDPRRLATQILNARANVGQGTLTLAGLSLLALAAGGPRLGGPEPLPIRPGRDLVVVLDRSRSMDVRDVDPSRLGRALATLDDLLAGLGQRGGHRAALVAFASRALVLVPWTHDLGHVASKARALAEPGSPEAAAVLQPGRVSGTRIGEALTRAIELLEPEIRGAQEIILLSDGDDPAPDEEWRLGAEAARQAGVRVHVVGIGDPNRSHPVPSATAAPRDDSPRDAAPEPQSRLREAVLRQIAETTGGRYLPARTGSAEWGRWLHDEFDPGPTREFVGGWLQPRARARLLLVPAALLLAAAMLPGRRGDQKLRGGLAGRVSWLRRGGWALAAGLALGAAATPEAWLARGQEALARGAYAEALAAFEQAALRTRDPGWVAFHRGLALFHLERDREAEAQFRAALSDPEPLRRPRAAYNLGCALLRQSRGRDAETLRQAVLAFEQALAEPALDAALRGDLEFNLELARALWQKARATKPPGSEESPEATPDSRPSSSPASAQGTSASDRNRAPGEVSPQGPAPSGEQPRATNQPPRPGRGNLPPLPDTATLAPLTPEDARDHLRQAWDRIRQARIERWRPPAATPATRYPDW